MIIRPGEFWVADIRFTDGSGSKKRPVLVLWLDGADTVVAAVTSAAICHRCSACRLEIGRTACRVQRSPLAAGLPGTNAAHGSYRRGQFQRRAVHQANLDQLGSTAILIAAPSVNNSCRSHSSSPGRCACRRR